ncbi:uncharacterized protein FOMMEDRAFT_167001 [Fomitiporia mediterranea MF3/22]|uniref:uncharacterized protein n=1 Tax=Fomitiporia mediterranea (strain MF3/22) TaxID=694068 RepID=UPI0004407E9C|nr:uncharacterized protein FOMMEDRAFT_167001 [Fomitiporia mediterranea MF3/22]EJD03651.1 hypothetical protein FOMMEDRAFT_167001 [Fomitiporia mediterranea MF3/22]
MPPKREHLVIERALGTRHGVFLKMKGIIQPSGISGKVEGFVMGHSARCATAFIMYTERWAHTSAVVTFS